MTKVFFISILASLGAAAVAWGLFLEYFGEKTEYRDIEDFRLSKQKAHRGQKWVFWGVIAEMILGFGVAIWDGAEMIKTDKQIEEADPRNQPINAISGYAIIEVRAKGDRELNLVKNLHQILANKWINFDLTPSTKLRQNPENVMVVFSKLPNDSPSEPSGKDIAIVGWIDSVNTVVSDSEKYAPNFCFVLQFEGSGLQNPDSLTFNELKFMQIEGLGNAGEVQPPLEVIGGQIDLKVNLDWPKTFKIPKQTNQLWRVSSLETNNEFLPAGYGVLTNLPPAK